MNTPFTNPLRKSGILKCSAVFWLIVFGCWPMTFAQVSDCGGFICTPQRFFEYPKSSYIGRFYDDRQVIQSQDLVRESNDDPWVVFSDRSNNPLYYGPGEAENDDTLGFMEQARVKRIEGNWLELHTPTYDVNGKVRYRSRGWMKAKYLVLSRRAITNERATPRKAMVLVSIPNLRPGETTKDVLQKKFYNSPILEKKNLNGKEAKRLEIYFILKETAGMLLLSRADKLAGVSDDELRADVPGWIPKANVTFWDHRICLELAYGVPTRDAYEGIEVPIFSSEVSLGKFKSNILYSKDSVFKKYTVGEKRQDPFVMRLPILRSDGGENYQVATIASLRDEKQQDSLNGIVAEKVERARAKAATVNILFVVDGTISMKNYYLPIAKSIETIAENSKNVKSDNKIRMGLAVYRDYKDGAKAYEFYPLTDNYAQFVNQVMGVVPSSTDTDLPEAPYNGLIKGMDDAFSDPGQSNVVVLIGDAGNTYPDAMGRTLGQVVDRLYKYEASFVAFQVNYLSDPTYLDFNTDMSKLMLQTAHRFLPGREKAARLEKLTDLNTLKLRFEVEGNGGEDSYFMFGRFTFASGSGAMPVSIFESSVSNALNEYLEKVNRLKATLSIARSGKGSFEPEFIDYLKRRGFSPLEIEILKEEGDVSTTGATSTHLKERDLPCFTPVAFMSATEKDVIDKALTKLVHGVGSSSNKRTDFQNALKVECTRILGNESVDIVDNMTLDSIWGLILALPFNGNRTLAGTQLKNLDQVPQNTFDPFYNEFLIAANKFIKNQYSDPKDPETYSRFRLADQYYLWIPLDDIPGCKSN